MAKSVVGSKILPRKGDVICNICFRVPCANATFKTLVFRFASGGSAWETVIPYKMRPNSDLERLCLILEPIVPQSWSNINKMTNNPPLHGNATREQVSVRSIKPYGGQRYISAHAYLTSSCIIASGLRINNRGNFGILCFSFERCLP